jgi:NADH-quinone oxidoreductase subunit M
MCVVCVAVDSVLVVMTGLLLTTLLLPLAVAILLLVGRAVFSQSVARNLALVAALVTLVFSLMLASEYMKIPPDAAPRSGVQPRFVKTFHWMSYGDASPDVAGQPQLQFDFLLGLDGVSVSLIVLTTLLTMSCVLVSWEAISDRAPGFYACLLLLETGLVGVFSSFDLVLFYVFFEFTLVPLFFLIGIWGGPQRRYAAVKFFLYTFAGSMVTLVGLVALMLIASSGGLRVPTSIPALAHWLAEHPLDKTTQIALFLAISVGFMVKIPVFPLHTWLPLAHVEAPTAGSVLLAGVLLKLGTYGILRLCLPMFPLASETVGVPMMAALGVAGIIYGSLCALAQRDIKKLVAYSSVAHLGFCILGLFALNATGISGGVLQMINHGLSTGALFLLVGMVYERYHTRMLDDLGGLAARLPLLACIMVFVAMSSIGLPGLNGFVGEVLSLAGMFRRHYAYAVLGTTGVILGAWYLLTMVQHAFFGPLREPAQGEHAVGDINLREVCAVAPICALCLAIGVMPQPILDLIRPDVDAVVAAYSQAANEEDHVAGTMATPAVDPGIHRTEIDSRPRDVVESNPDATSSASALVVRGLWSGTAVDRAGGQIASCYFPRSKLEAFDSSLTDTAVADDRTGWVTSNKGHSQSQWRSGFNTRSWGNVDLSVAGAPSG